MTKERKLRVHVETLSGSGGRLRSRAEREPFRLSGDKEKSRPVSRLPILRAAKVTHATRHGPSA